MFRLTRQPFKKFFEASRGALSIVAIVFLGAFLSLGQWGGIAAAQSDSSTPRPMAGEDDASKPCFDGRLRIDDLEGAQETLADGFANADAIAKAWQPDARLFALRLGCPLLETGYQWEGTYFSQQAQAFFETDTWAVQPSEDDPATIPTLDPTTIEILPVYRSLLKAGYDEASAFGALGGLTIRPSTPEQPFGPPTAPRDDIYFHVAILERGEVIDVWIASRDATIYRYEV